METVVLILGVAILFQFIIVRVKWNNRRYADVIVDLLMLLLLNVIFGGTILGALGATAGATLISLYLIWKPITFGANAAFSDFISEVKTMLT